jgi:HPt (histidine-containing phosphotransfer) domain-containing protein
MRRIDPVRTWHDHLLEDVRQVLIAIGGEGVSRLLAHELKHTQGRQAYVALQLAPMVPWPGIEGALVDHVASVANTDMDTRRISVIFALHALASLDFTEELIALVRTQEPELVHRQSIDIRRGAAPFAPHHVSTIAKRLASAGLSDSELLRELLLAALSQAPELVPAIEKQLHESSDVRTFRYASHALLALDACSESTALAARRWLDNRNGSKLALRLLLRCDTPACHRVVLDFVRGQVATNPMVVAWVIPYLPNEGPLGAEADALAVDIFRRTPMATDAYSRVIRTGDVELVSSLRLLAFRREEGLVGMQPAAICALQQLDPVDAVEAALNMLRQGTSHDEFGAQFIMRQGSHDQCLRLVELAQTLGRDGLWAHCGRALRRRSPDSQIALMAQWRTSESLSAARAFAEMAGWLGPTYLKEVTDRLSLEHRRSICRALEQASTRITQLDTLEHHLQSLHDAEGPERLALLTACLAAGEPFLLATSSDPLGIARALAPHPSYFRAYAENELEQLCKKWKPPKG